MELLLLRLQLYCPVVRLEHCTQRPRPLGVQTPVNLPRAHPFPRLETENVPNNLAGKVAKCQLTLHREPNG